MNLSEFQTNYFFRTFETIFKSSQIRKAEKNSKQTILKENPKNSQNLQNRFKMPFVRGVAPIRRSLDYLKSGPIVFKERVKVLTVNYNDYEQYKTYKKDHPHHQGAKEFVFWTLPQLQYKNENLQIATFKNMTPSPFITCYLDDGKKVIFDIDNQTKDEIIQRLKKTLGKTEKTLAEEALALQKKDNPANFGYFTDRYCLCAESGQVPCPGFIRLPNSYRGKIVFGEEEEEY